MEMQKSAVPLIISQKLFNQKFVCFLDLQYDKASLIHNRRERLRGKERDIEWKGERYEREGEKVREREDTERDRET
jgi:hypothetical protein